MKLFRDSRYEDACGGTLVRVCVVAMMRESVIGAPDQWS